MKKREKPKCLLVYSPTRLSHVNVMVELAKYLRVCDINAMIDVLDIKDTMDKVSTSNSFQNKILLLQKSYFTIYYGCDIGSRMLV